MLDWESVPRPPKDCIIWRTDELFGGFKEGIDERWMTNGPPNGRRKWAKLCANVCRRDSFPSFVRCDKKSPFFGFLDFSFPPISRPLFSDEEKLGHKLAKNGFGSDGWNLIK